jgi:stearoyl-CoA desaturase (delta-9 desaturase)
MARAVAPVEPQLEKSMGEKIGVLIAVVVPFVATLYAIVLLWQQYVGWRDIALLLTFYVLAGLGITVGFHRMLTHKSFETHPAVRFIFLVMGCLAVEGSPLEWASTHIQHHANSDGEDDPHSPLEGFWHAHFGWLFAFKNNPNVYGTWLQRDPMVMFVTKYWLAFAALGLIIPFAIGGWTGLLWGGAVRIFLGHHVTWSVNSICHTFGERPFQTRDASRNNFIVGLLAFGEGWHNNHHAFPRSAFHGLRWWQVDTSAYLIRTLERTGLVWNVHRVKEADERKRSSAPRGNEAAWDLDVQG